MFFHSKNVTLIFVFNKEKDKVLLIHKKRGFGKGKLNGVGGKVEEKETIVESALRELKEEVSLKAKSLDKKAVLFFKNYDTKVKLYESMLCHVFFVYDYEGLEKESEEAKPEWFFLNNIPFDRMWEDDIFWLPKTLKEKFVYGEFYFEDWNLKKHKVYSLK